MSEDREEYDLKKSIKKFGILVPVIKDQKGNVIDGLHRLEIDPKAPIHTIKIKDEIERAMIRLIVNTDRRTVPSEEKTKLLGEIKRKTKWSVKQIAYALCKSPSWVYKYLPENMKDQERAEATRLGIIEHDLHGVEVGSKTPDMLKYEISDLLLKDGYGPITMGSDVAPIYVLPGLNLAITFDVDRKPQQIVPERILIIPRKGLTAKQIAAQIEDAIDKIERDKLIEAELEKKD